jgi:predicted ATP-dependent serine protease
MAEMIIERVSSGIPELDEKLEGGFPENSTIAIIGAFGTGKSTFGMQFLNSGLQNGEHCILISLDDPAETDCDRYQNIDTPHPKRTATTLRDVRRETMRVRLDNALRNAVHKRKRTETDRIRPCSGDEE